MLENFYCDKTKPDPKFKGFQTLTHKINSKRNAPISQIQSLVYYKSLISNNIIGYFGKSNIKYIVLVVVKIICGSCRLY